MTGSTSGSTRNEGVRKLVRALLTQVEELIRSGDSDAAGSLLARLTDMDKDPSTRLEWKEHERVLEYRQALGLPVELDRGNKKKI